ncbi:unnamed protein product [Rotaria socialis]|uniref:Uncharacterized protein n=1 Tax=Rotaria socialis TaxID=392032 RepID=A0A818C2W1_9BILA|nr:unnamed protein product [Rotaria socialis]
MKAYPRVELRNFLLSTIQLSTKVFQSISKYFKAFQSTSKYLKVLKVQNSDDEEDPSRLSIATPPTPTVENERSRAIRETASTPLVTMKKLSNNTKSTKSTSISSSKKLASAHQQENAVDKIQQSKKHHSTGYTKT